MTLSSNNTTDSSNTIALFDTQLTKNFELDDSWYVGLAEFSYTKSWFNIRRDMSIMLVDENEQMYPSSIKLPAGYYKSEDDVAMNINNIIKTIECDVSTYPRLGFDIYGRRVRVTEGYKKDDVRLFLWLSDDLCDMLGLKFQGPKETSTLDEHGVLRVNTINAGLTSFRAYDLSAGIHSLFVYCDIIEPSFVGDDYASVLRTVNINHVDEFGKDCENIFNPIHYHKLTRSRFQRISIGLYDDSGEVISFKFGRTKAVLHFKRNEEQRIY